MSQRDDFELWLEQGITNGWCSELVCDTHQGLPMSEGEEEDWWKGNEPCIPAVRLYGMERVL